MTFWIILLILVLLAILALMIVQLVTPYVRSHVESVHRFDGVSTSRLETGETLNVLARVAYKDNITPTVTRTELSNIITTDVLADTAYLPADARFEVVASKMAQKIYQHTELDGAAVVLSITDGTTTTQYTAEVGGVREGRQELVNGA